MHATEIARGDRFEFGANWARVLSFVNEDRIGCGVSDLQGKRFLDIGSGSGLFNLATRRLGSFLVLKAAANYSRFHLHLHKTQPGKRMAFYANCSTTPRRHDVPNWRASVLAGQMEGRS